MPVTACASCGVSGQPDGARFCFSCGSDMLAAVRCPSCAAEVVPGARFCSSCGTVQPGESPSAAAQVSARRVTSVLFGDLVGFTSLSEDRDQEDVRELLSRYFDECRQVVERYGGTVEKFIGDAVMAVWGVPTAHEDDAERAVRAGLELVALVEAMGTDVGVEGLAMRVGIVTGEVAVTVGATHQGMVAGDAVNTAARVQSAAAPGQVWVDETTRLLTSSAISYVDVGSHQLKGKVDPVPLWAVRAVVAAVGGAQRADGLEAPHTGRDRELRLVKEVFHGVEESGRPSLMLVVGEPGIGKTRLGWEFDKYTDGLNTGVYWHRGRCLSYGEGVAFYALAEAIRGRLQSLRPDDPETDGATDTDEDQARLIAEGLDVLVTDPEERAWLEPRIATLLGVGSGGAFKREDLFTAWTTMFRRIRRNDDPVVLLVDDAQYADDGLVAFFEHLVTVADFPVFVLLMARPALLDDRPTLAAHRRVSVLHLETLSDAHMGDLVDGLVVGLPAGLRTSLVERAEGVPLFAVETVRSLIDRDLVLPRGGQYVLADRDGIDLEQLEAPASLHALIAARLDALPPDHRRVVDMASVVGSSFTREQIAALCADVTDLDQVLGGLVRLQVLRQESDRLSAERGQFQFVQTGVRQVAHGTLSRRDRKAAHLAVAQILESADNSAGELSPIIAQHFLEAVDAMPHDEDTEELLERAVTHLGRAGSRASALGAPVEAAAHFRAGLERSTDPAWRARIGCELAEELLRSSSYDQAIATATEALAYFDRVGDVLGGARATAKLARGLILGPGELDRAQALVLERLDALSTVEGGHREELELAGVRVSACLRTGENLREAAEHHARLADLVGDDFDIADSYVSLGLHFMVTGPHGLARVLLESAAERARAAHDHRLLARALTNLNADSTAYDARRAVDYGLEALAAARSVGDRRWVSSSALNLMLALFVAGDWDQLVALYEELDLDPNDRLMAGVVLARVREVRGEVPDVSPVDGVADAEDLALQSFVLALMAQGRVRQGQPVGDLLVESADVMHRQAGIADDFTLLFQVVSDLAWETGDRAALAGLLDVYARDPALRIPAGLTTQVARLRGLCGAADGADPAEVEHLFRTARAEARAWQSPVAEARVCAELADFLVRVDRADEAAPLLASARAEFERLGAVRWLSELDLTAVQV